ncbi:MAG TPA: low temperature requirement protein A [Gaiellaceae bacterium]
MEHAAGDERTVRVSTLELFFDLVFVFTLTQLTGLLAEDSDLSGLAKVVLLFSVIWWIYDGYVWLTNALTVDVLGSRLLMIGGMAGFLIMALAIPTTFGDGGVAFGLGYLAVVALHSGLYMRATSARDAAAIRGIVPYNLAAALLLLGAGFAGGALKWGLVIAAAALLWSVPFIVPLEGFQITASHFVERHGLVVIVALGESIVVLGAGAAGAEVGLELAFIALLALALSASLWWTYFRDEGPFEHALLSAPAARRPRLAIDFGYAHFFLLLGVVLVAAGLKKAIPDPSGSLDDFTAVALAGGTAMFLAADAGLRGVLGIGRSRALAVASVVMLATVPLGTAVSAAAQVAAIVAIVTLALVSDRPRAGTATRTAH